MQKGKSTAAYIFLLITFFLWGSMYVAGKFAMQTLPTFTVCFFRFSIAYLTLTLLQTVRDRRRDAAGGDAGEDARPTVIEKKDRPWIVLIGVLGYFMSAGSTFFGTRYAGASLSSLMNAMNPVTISLFGVLILKERLSLRKAFGIVLAIVGVYVILARNEGGSIIGVLFNILAVTLWSLVSVLVRRITQKYDPIAVTRKGISVGLICYFIAAGIETAINGVPRFTLPVVLSLLYMGVFGTAAAHTLWNLSLQRLEASTCSAFYPLQPLVSALLGMWLLHEQNGPRFWIGAALIIAGILISLIHPGSGSARSIPSTKQE
ncbi:MAG: DMT family transporter [Firmicutes bacterium]|nr:DMT family transporter [Bacillota bacterium]